MICHHCHHNALLSPLFIEFCDRSYALIFQNVNEYILSFDAQFIQKVFRGKMCR